MATPPHPVASRPTSFPRGEVKKYLAAILIVVFFTPLASPAHADLQLCNRTSFVVEAALGVEEKGVTATRGWFRVDPGACRTVLRGDPTADRLLVHARALALYGSVRPLNAAQVQLCVGEGDFLVAGAQRCKDANQRLVPFAEVRPRATPNGLALQLAEPADYGAEQARLAAIQRLLVLAGYGAEPIDGVPGPRTDAALALFLRERGLGSDASSSAIFLDLLMDAVREGSGPGLLWCNETAHAVMAALGVEEAAGLVARGWWRVEPGACVRPDLPVSSLRAGRSPSGLAGANGRTGARVFSYAEAVDAAGAVIEKKGRPLAWGGATQLCVRNSRFEIRDHADCAARGLTAQGFAAVELAHRTGATLRFREP
jgi:uncharacterized membrane protein